LGLYHTGNHAKALEILIRQLADNTTDESIKTYWRALIFYSDKLGEIFE